MVTFWAYYKSSAVVTYSNVVIMIGMVEMVIEAWLSNHIPSKDWDEITYPIPNFNGHTIEVWKWISNLISHFIMDVITDVITYPYWD